MLALLYDVHGNLPALDAVLEDARGQGADRWVLGGDYALFGGWPAETVERLRSLDPALWIRGNGERWAADPSAAPDDPTVQGAIAAVREALGTDVVEDLASLPFSCPRGHTLICHGSPRSDVESFLPEPSDDDRALLDGVDAERIVFGHTHLPFARSLGEVSLVNPGSVGVPLDGDHRASYALLHEDGRVEHRRVAYDYSASADRVRGLGGQWSETIAGRIDRASL